MASNGIPERKEHEHAAHLTSMPHEAPPIDEEELKLLTPPPPTHNRINPYPLPTPGFLENSLDQDQPPDSFWGIPAWQVFPRIYDIKRHSPVHVSARPRPYVSQFLPVPSFVDLVVGHALDSAIALTAVGILGAIPGVYLRRTAPLSSRILAGAFTGITSASLFFPLYRYTIYKLVVRSRLEDDRKSPSRPAIPMSARRSWVGMDEEGNVRQTFGYFQENPYQRWEDANWHSRRRNIWEAVYKKIDQQKLKEALEKREKRDRPVQKEQKGKEEQHH